MAKRRAEKKGKAKTSKASKSSGTANGKKAPSPAQIAAREKFAAESRARAAGSKGAAKASAKNAKVERPKATPSGKKAGKKLRAKAVADAPKAVERMKKNRKPRKPLQGGAFRRKGPYDAYETGEKLKVGKRTITVQANGKAELPVDELIKRRNSLDTLIKSRQAGKHLACPPTHPR